MKKSDVCILAVLGACLITLVYAYIQIFVIFFTGGRP